MRAVLWGAVGALAIAAAVMATRHVDAEAAAAREAELRAQAERATEQAQVVAAQARLATDRALARQLAAELVTLPDERIDLAALLAVAVSRLTDGADAHRGLDNLWSRAPRLLAAIPVDVKLRRLARSADERRVAGLDDHGRLWQWDLQTRQIPAEALPGVYTDLAFDRLRGRFVTVDDTRAVIFWNANGTAARRIAGTSARGPVALAVTPDGAYVATADAAGRVEVNVASTGVRVATAEVGAIAVADVEALRFSMDGRSLAIAQPGRVGLWRWRDGHKVLHAEGDAVAVRFIRGGLVGLDDTGVVRRWTIGEGRISAKGSVNAFAWDANGADRLLALGLADDGTAAAVVCLDACTREVLRVFDGIRTVDAAIQLRDRPGERRRFPLAADGAAAVVGGAQAIRVLATRPRSDDVDEVAEACQLAGRDMTAEEWDEHVGGDRPQLRLCPGRAP